MSVPKLRDTLHSSQQDQKVFDLINYCKQNGLIFKDKSFLAGQHAFGGTPLHPDYKHKFRKFEMIKADKLFGKGKYAMFASIRPDDIVQGYLGNCYFLTALTVMAEHPELIRRLFDVDVISENGVYAVWINVNGVWRNIIVDDYFPVQRSNQGFKPAFSCTSAKDIWLMLLEKAYAKAYGSYFDIIGGNPVNALRDLTGAPFETIKDLSNSNYVWLRVKSALQKQCLVVCSPPVIQFMTRKNDDTDEISGIVYSILDAREVIDSFRRKHLIIKVKIPWGNFQWKGDFSYNSLHWTRELKQQLCDFDQKERLYWFKIEEFVRQFESVSIISLQPNYLSNSITLREVTSKISIVRLELAEKTHISIAVNQLDPKLVDNPDYTYSPFRVTFGRLTGKSGIEYIDAVVSNERTIFIDKTLEYGAYVILIEPNWVSDEANEFTISTYSEKSVELELLKLSDSTINLAEYLIWKSFALKNKSSFVMLHSQDLKMSRTEFSIQQFKFDDARSHNSLFYIHNTSNKFTVHQSFSFFLNGMTPHGRYCSSNEFTLMANPQDGDIIIFRNDLTQEFSSSTQRSTTINMQGQEVIPYTFSGVDDAIEYMNLLGGYQPTAINENPKIVSKLDKLAILKKAKKAIEKMPTAEVSVRSRSLQKITITEKPTMRLQSLTRIPSNQGTLSSVIIRSPSVLHKHFNG